MKIPSLGALALSLLPAACAAPSSSGPMSQQHHVIDYIELTVRDLAEARAFYGAAFGWEFNDYGPEYAGIRRPDGEGEVGGMTPGDVVAGGPLVILYSDDLEASVRAVEAAGGTISTAPFAFPGGRRFHFRDPAGNELAVWTKEGGEPLGG